MLPEGMMQPDGSNNVARGWYIFPYPSGKVGILSCVLLGLGFSVLERAQTEGL